MQIQTLINPAFQNTNTQLAILKEQQWLQFSKLLDDLDLSHTASNLFDNVDYRCHIKTFIKFMSFTRWLDTKDNVLVDYQDHLLKQELKARSINKKVTLAHLLVKHLHEQGWIPSYIQPRKIKVVDHKYGFTHEEVIEIAKHVGDLYPLFCLLAIEGFRKGEALALTVDDIDFEAGTIKLKSKGHVEKIDWPASSETLLALKRYIKDDTTASTQLFTMAPSTVNRRFAKIFKKLHIHNRTVHSFRHYLCTRMLDEGMDIREVQVYMRHASKSTTEGYDDMRLSKLITIKAHKILLHENKDNNDR